MTPEEEIALEAATDSFIDSYVNSLYIGSVRAQSAATVEAMDELNKGLRENGLPEREIPPSSMREALQDSANYRSMLMDQGGSYVVVQLAGTEALEFRPWIDDLRLDTQDAVKEIWEKANIENWSGARLDGELRALQEFTINKRARVAAFTEIRNWQYQAQMRTWEDSGLEFVQRRAVDASEVCLTCAVYDNRVFRVGEEPPLSHPNCRCFYTPYITKRAWSPDYDKNEWDAEGYSVGPSFEYTRGRNRIPYEDTGNFPLVSDRKRIHSTLPLHAEALELDFSKLSEFDRNFYKYVEPERRHLFINTDQKRKEQLLKLWIKRESEPKYPIPERLEKPKVKVPVPTKVEKPIEPKTPKLKAVEKPKIVEKSKPEKKELVYFFKTKTSDIEKWIEENTKIKNVHFDNLDTGVINEVMKSYTETVNLAPRVADRIEYIGTGDYQFDAIRRERINASMRVFTQYDKLSDSEALRKAEGMYPQMAMDKRTMAHSWSGETLQGYGGIAINEQYGKDYNFFTGRIQFNVTTHFHPEGTGTVKALFDHELGHEIDKAYGISNDKRIKELFKKETADTMTRKLSTYAAKDEMEFVAEAWAEYRNNPNPRPMAKTVGDIMMAKIKGAKK